MKVTHHSTRVQLPVVSLVRVPYPNSLGSDTQLAVDSWTGDIRLVSKLLHHHKMYANFRYSLTASPPRCQGMLASTFVLCTILSTPAPMLASVWCVQVQLQISVSPG